MSADRDLPSKPILCIDFDGVIHSYTSGWRGDDIVQDDVIPGFFEWAMEAQEHFTLTIYSSRSKTETGRLAMGTWLRDRLVEWSADRASSDNTTKPIEFHIAAEKPHAFLTIDDRAMQFRGDWSAWWLRPEALLKFKPWNKT